MGDLMWAAIGLVGFFLSAVTVNLICEQVNASVPAGSEWLRQLAVKRLPEQLRERYDEEWAALLNETPGPLAKMWRAFGFFVSAPDLQMEGEPHLQREEAKRVQQITDQLLRSLKQRKPNDLRLVVDEALELATLDIDAPGITVSTELPMEPVIVKIDRHEIMILVANLIRNAIDELHISQNQKRIWLRLRVTGEGLAEFSVEDTGRGIAEEIFEAIFTPFYTTKPRGLGIGLSVSQRIALANGGHLAAHNRTEGGAKFSFVMPIV